MLYVKLHRNFKQKIFSVHLFIREHTRKLPIHLHLSCYFETEEDEPALQKIQVVHFIREMMSLWR